MGKYRVKDAAYKWNPYDIYKRKGYGAYLISLLIRYMVSLKEILLG